MSIIPTWLGRYGIVKISRLRVKVAVLASGGKETNQRIVRSRSGHVIILDDTKGKEKIIIEDKTGKK